MSVPTIKDVAAAAGVSTAAVSLYLNDRAGISQATRARIAATIKSLGYVPRANGRRSGSNLQQQLKQSLRGKKSA